MHINPLHAAFALLTAGIDQKVRHAAATADQSSSLHESAVLQNVLIALGQSAELSIGELASVISADQSPYLARVLVAADQNGVVRLAPGGSGGLIVRLTEQAEEDERALSPSAASHGGWRCCTSETYGRRQR